MVFPAGEPASDTTLAMTGVTSASAGPRNHRGSEGGVLQISFKTISFKSQTQNHNIGQYNLKTVTIKHTFEELFLPGDSFTAEL